MQPNHKKTLRALSLELRHILEGHYDQEGKFHPGDLERRLNSLGVWRDRPPKPSDELPHLSPEDREARKVVDAYIYFREEAGVSRAEAVSEFIRESAYTWANRLLALRCMEARGIIDEVILQKEAYGGRSLEHHRFAKKNPEACSGEDDGLFAVLAKQFAAMSRELPALFDPQAPAISLHPSVPALKRCIALLSGTEALKGQEPATDVVFEAPDALGWAYQYWQEEEKKRVDDLLGDRGSGFKCQGYDLIPKTALYTEPYMVKFLVQNSLGATWMGMHPESRLMENWEYYVKDADRVPTEPKPISEVTFLDPACGSGHFLLEAFDLYYSMYKEEDPTLSPKEICTSILSRNLYGIDIDERAVQIAQAVLWMKAKEYAPDFSLAPIAQEFSSHLIASNIRLPKGKDHLRAFLEKHPEDEPLRTALEAAFEGLENVHELGSLLQIEEPVEKELRYLQKKYEEAISIGGIQQNLLEKTVIQGELPLGVESYEDWKERIISRLKEHFQTEAESSDLSQSFFGQSAGKGLALFDLLSRRYDVVAANPPYLGSGNMGEMEKKYIAKHYEPGKRDLYAAFILRNIQLCQEKGRVAMVTQQTWMFLRNFSSLRALEEGQLKKVSKDYFKGVLRETSVEALAHLGSNAFGEISGEVVSVALFILSKETPSQGHKLTAFRLVGLRWPEEKNQFLRQSLKVEKSKIRYSILNSDLLRFPLTIIAYWLQGALKEHISSDEHIGDYAECLAGLQTGDAARFVRYHWEILELDMGWIPYVQGGGFRRWAGLEHGILRWRLDGKEIKDHPSSRWQGTQKFLKPGLTYTEFCRGAFGVRILDGSGFSQAGSAIFPKRNISRYALAARLSTHTMSFLLRLMRGALVFSAGYVARLPMPPLTDTAEKIGALACDLAICRTRVELLEKNFDPRELFEIDNDKMLRIDAWLSFLTGLSERSLVRDLQLDEDAIDVIIAETGKPAAWYQLIDGYEMLPPIPSEISIEHIEVALEGGINQIGSKELATLRSELRELYKKGPGSGNDSTEGGYINITEEDDERIQCGAHNPIPPETFLEELSQKLQIHPISVYWMLKEGIEKEGWRCLPEEKRITEDRFTVIVLRLLGHRWPKQIEAGEPVPDWADQDGIIPITKGIGEKTLYERVKERIAEEFPGGDVSSIEKQFEEVVGTSLEKWLSGPFYRRHISQFKKRPIAWQVQSQRQTSKGKGKKGISAQPAFSCLVYYHKLDLDFLPKIRTQYVGPLRSSYETELRTLERVSELTTAQSARKAQLELWIDELSDFDARLAAVSLEGFDCDKLKEIVASEPLDEWTSRDGIASPPATQEELYLQEKRYDPDINDGVRVNIAPLQKAGLLAADVLTEKDLDKAISDRAEWRSDERRWCREGKLPKPGWWKE